MATNVEELRTLIIDLLDQVAELAADDARFKRAAGQLRAAEGRNGGRPAMDDQEALSLVNWRLARNLARSQHAALEAVAVEIARDSDGTATTKSIAERLRRKRKKAPTEVC